MAQRGLGSSGIASSVQAPAPRAAGLFLRPRQLRHTRTRPHSSGRYARRAQRARKSAKAPWLLVTSFDNTPESVVGIYALRMQTEETFRDLKSHRFGWSFEDARSKDHLRMATMLLLAALAAAITMLAGLAAEALGLAGRYQANTIRNRRVLSASTWARLSSAQGTTSLCLQRCCVICCRPSLHRLGEMVGIHQGHSTFSSPARPTVAWRGSAVRLWPRRWPYVE